MKRWGPGNLLAATSAEELEQVINSWQQAAPGTQLPGEVIEAAKKAFESISVSLRELNNVQEKFESREQSAKEIMNTRLLDMKLEAENMDTAKAMDLLREKEVVLREWYENAMAPLKSCLEESKEHYAACQASYHETVEKVATLLGGKVAAPINVDTQSTEADGEKSAAATDLAPAMEADGKKFAPPANPANTAATATEALVELQSLLNGKFGTALPEAARAKILEQFHTTLKDSFSEVGADSAGKPAEVSAPVNAKSVEAVPGARNAEARLSAVAAEFQRKDTSQMALEEGQVMVDGVLMYRTSKGKLETLEQRNKRLAHNLYVKFSRSLEGVLVAM